MRPRPVLAFRPDLERLEAKATLSSGAMTTPVAALDVGPETRAIPAAEQAPEDAPEVVVAREGRPAKKAKLQLSRITNPTLGIARLDPPFQQVRVQSKVPIPGQVYNVLSVSVRNSTKQIFDADRGIRVRVTGSRQSFPAVTGTDQWKPGEFRVFYIFSKKYYPIRPVTSAGFEFDLGGARGVAIPGPSGIFLRLPYRPERFADSLDRIISEGPGSKGTELGLPNTAIWEITTTRTRIIPL